MKSEPYEGDEPYLFISYSHEDDGFLNEITALFDREGIRYWFDSERNSGEDCCKVKTEHLKNASVCLFLCTEKSWKSDDVRDELTFAKSYRISLVSLMDGSFEANDEIKQMIGHMYWTTKQEGYEKELFHVLPAEVYHLNDIVIPQKKHPLYEVKQEVWKEKGTVIYLGNHRTLGYQVKIIKGCVKDEDIIGAWVNLREASKFHHPQFPIIHDAVINNHQMTVYEECMDGERLPDYLERNTPTEQQILNIARSFVNGMKYLYENAFSMRSFSQNTLIGRNNTVYFDNIHNLYHGLVRMTPETRPYYFDKMLEEIGVVLSWLATGEMPLLPLKDIDNQIYSIRFLNRINVMIQQCQKGVQGRMYASLDEVLIDLKTEKLSLPKILSLQQRKSSREKYERELSSYLLDPHGDALDPFSRSPYDDGIRFPNSLEEEQESATSITVSEENELDVNSFIRIESLSNGHKSFFSEDAVVIGSGEDCDLRIEQETISQKHIKITRKEGVYLLEDLNSTNETKILRDDTVIVVDHTKECKIQSEDIIVLGDTSLRIIIEKTEETEDDSPTQSQG